MQRVLTALVLVPLALALVFIGPKWLLTAAVALISILAAWEFIGLTEKGGAKPPKAAVAAALGVLFGVNFEVPDQTLVVFCGLCIILLAYITFRSPVERVLFDMVSSIFAMCYTGLTLLAIPILREQPNGPSLVVFLLFNVWAGDIFAFYIGRRWGEQKLAPTISPNKTWEGAIGSVSGSLIVTGCLLALASEMAKRDIVLLSFSDEVWWYWVMMSVGVNIAAQIGDLAESALKRSAGVKDSGTLLPGHGGILDRIDALLLAAPVLWYVQVMR